MANPLSGFFRRILTTLGLGSGDTTPESPSPVEPPPFEHQYSDFPPPGYVNLNDPNHANKREYVYVTGERRYPDNDFDDWWDLYTDTGITRIEHSRSEVDRLWGKFLRAFYLTGDDDGNISRNDFYTDSGLTARRIDWQKWREAKHSN